jgi:hypothetical protein
MNTGFPVPQLPPWPVLRHGRHHHPDGDGRHQQFNLTRGGTIFLPSTRYIEDGQMLGDDTSGRLKLSVRPVR